MIVSIIPVLSKEHRNKYSVYNNRKATHIIQKITLSNMKDSRGLYISKVYDLTEFDDQVSLYRQFYAYISNKPSASTMLDFSNNQEIQDTAPRDLDITVIGQSFGEFVYEVGTEGNMVNIIVKDTRDKKLDELAYNYRQSRKRKLMGLDRDIV